MAILMTPKQSFACPTDGLVPLPGIPSDKTTFSLRRGQPTEKNIGIFAFLPKSGTDFSTQVPGPAAILLRHREIKCFPPTSNLFCLLYRFR